MSILDHCEKISSDEPSSKISSIPETKKNDLTTLLILTYSDSQNEIFYLDYEVAVTAATEIIKAVEDGKPRAIHIHPPEDKDKIIIFLDQIPRTIRIKHVGSLPDFQS